MKYNGSKTRQVEMSDIRRQCVSNTDVTTVMYTNFNLIEMDLAHLNSYDRGIHSVHDLCVNATGYIEV